MEWGILIPPWQEAEPQEVELSERTSVEEWLGRYWLPLELPGAEAALLVSSLGIPHPGRWWSPTPNNRASHLSWLFGSSTRAFGGAALLVRNARAPGDGRVPEPLRSYVLGPGRFRVRIRTDESVDAWYTQEEVFDDYFDAVAAAVNLRYDWPHAIREIEVEGLSSIRPY